MARLGRQARLFGMITMTSLFFFVEIVVGYLTGSIALIADSFHMLSDVIALVVAVYAIRLAKRNRATKSNSFGWQRAEILGALINGVFLLALCFTIFVEAVQRFFQIEPIEEPMIVLIVGGVGLAINLVGLLLFSGHGGHGHSHGGHGHSHGGGGGHGHSHSHKEQQNVEMSSKRADRETNVALEVGKTYKARRHVAFGEGDRLRFGEGDEVLVLRHLEGNFYLGRANQAEGRFDAKDVRVARGDDERSSSFRAEEEAAEAEEERVEKEAVETVLHGPAQSGGGHNMRAAFLHVLGDALGSVGVIVVALVVWLTDWSWKYYLDPVISLVITALIVFSTVPLVKETAFILLQGVPNFDFEGLRGSLKAIPGVINIHELHVWRLADNKLIGSAHITAAVTSVSMEIATKAQQIFHRFDVHSSTIQTEYVAGGRPSLDFSNPDSEGEVAIGEDDRACLLACDPQCKPQECCTDPATHV